MSSIDATHGEPLVLEQRAVLKSFVGLSIKNALLNIVTLTLYRFWGKTQVRRRIWSTTAVNGEPLEYTGRGMELFIGFLLAMAAFGLPLLLITFAAQLLGPLKSVAVILPVYTLLIFLMGLGLFTAFRYMASRTAWRGIRFKLEGSPVRYGLKFLGYLLLSVVTLGWFWPAARRRLAGALWGGLWFGDRAFRFDLDEARKTKVYGLYALGWVGAFVAYIVGIAVITIAAIPLAAAQKPGVPTPPGLEWIAGVYAVIIVMMLAILLAFSPYHAAALRSVASGVSLDGVRFRLALKGREIAWLTLSSLGLLFVSLGFLMPLIEVRAIRFMVRRLEATGKIDLSAIGQAAGLGPRTGEGLADAFGLSPI